MADVHVEQMRSEASGPIHTEQVEQVRGMLRKTSGALVLTDESVTFLPEQGSPLIVSLSELAWVEMARRSRDTVVELTLRTAVVYRFRVASNDWVQRIMRARAALATPVSPVALAS